MIFPVRFGEDDVNQLVEIFKTFNRTINPNSSHD